jgi:hypothetical protein
VGLAQMRGHGAQVGGGAQQRHVSDPAAIRANLDPAPLGAALQMDGQPDGVGHHHRIGEDAGGPEERVALALDHLHAAQGDGDRSEPAVERRQRRRAAGRDVSLPDATGVPLVDLAKATPAARAGPGLHPAKRKRGAPAIKPRAGQPSEGGPSSGGRRRRAKEDGA